MDRKSSYPEVQCVKKFPMSQFNFTDDIKNEKDIEKQIARGRALCMKVRFKNLNTRHLCPYLSYSKCVVDGKVLLDNGRILVNKGECETCITDIDYDIIRSMYIWDEMEVLECMYARYGFLPEKFINVIHSYFIIKDSLTGLEERKLEYNNAKAKINSIYGMTAQDPGKDKIIYIDEGIIIDELIKFFALDETKDFTNGLLPYQWGVWTTAMARRELQKGIDAAGKNFVYADTDSVKQIGKPEWLDRYNKYKIEECEKTKGAVGKTYLGVFEVENNGKPYDKFITWGAKKYADELDGVLTITVAGVPKVKGSIELKKKGGIEFLKPGMRFKDSGKLGLTYVDDFKDIVIDGMVFKSGPCIVLRPLEYLLSLSEDYESLIFGLKRGDDVYEVDLFG